MSSAITVSAKNHLLFWVCTFFVFLGFVWVVGDVLLPFVLGFAIAYLLDPFVTFLGNHKVPRSLASLGILGLFVIFVMVVLALITPPLYREIVELAEAMPTYVDKLMEMMSPYITWLQDKFSNGDFEKFQQTLQTNLGRALRIGSDVVSSLASGGQAFAGFLSVSILTPIVAFFMMNEWPSIKAWVDDLLPRDSRATIKKLLSEIDMKLAGFVRGQITISFALAIIYALALTFAGLQFGFMIGLMAGILSIIPLVGSTIGLFVSVLVAWFQSHELLYVGIIAVIFFVGQFVEGNFLTPRLLGKSVGLHPLWILFALLAGGSLFGIVGMLLSVPVAASVGVLLSFALSEYKKSPFYKSSSPPKKAARKSAKKTKK
jgi:predicted PurR-regulated permease PerM